MLARYIIIIIIYLLHKSIQRTKYSNMNSGAGQQDSCPETTELHKTIQNKN